MFNANYGDLAQPFLLRRNTAAVTGDLTRLTQELTSGRKADLQAHLRGDFGPLAGLERGLSLQAAFGRSNSTATQFANAQQISLERVQATLVDQGPSLVNAGASGEATQMRLAFRSAANHLDQVVNALNTRNADRSIFAGSNTQNLALADPDTILTALDAALAGQTTAAGVLAAADTWFDTPGGGFETIAYTGGTTPLAPFDIGDGETERLDLTAMDPALRETVKGLALAALMDRGLLGGSAAERADLLESAGGRLINATDDVIGLRAQIGFSEARIEAARVRGEAETASLAAARSALIGADPYETALRLNEVEVQLSTIYAVTARLSGLSLSSYLR